MQLIQRIDQKVGLAFELPVLRLQVQYTLLRHRLLFRVPLLILIVILNLSNLVLEFAILLLEQLENELHLL